MVLGYCYYNILFHILFYAVCVTVSPLQIYQETIDHLYLYITFYALYNV